MQLLRPMLFSLMVVLSAGSIKAQMTVARYRENMQSETTRMQTTNYIRGLGNAYSFANVRLEQEKKPPFYCPPQKLALSVDNYIRILNDRIDKDTRILGGESAKVDTYFIEMLLLDGLQDTFPCTLQKLQVQ